MYYLTFTVVTIFCGYLLFRPMLTDLGYLLYYLGYHFIPIHISGKSKRFRLGIIGRELYNWVVIVDLFY